MRLSLVCWFKKSVPGHIFRGKYRLVKRVSINAMGTQVREYERQDKIMHLLRYPYLTPVSDCFVCFVVVVFSLFYIHFKFAVVESVFCDN